MVTIQRCQEGSMDTGFHCGYNTDYQYRKPSRALGQEEILPSIPAHNLPQRDDNNYIRKLLAVLIWGQDFFLRQAPMRGFLRPKAQSEGNMEHTNASWSGSCMEVRLS